MKTNEFPSYEEIEKTDGFDRILITKNEAGRCLHICPRGMADMDEDGRRYPRKVGANACRRCAHFVRTEMLGEYDVVVCSHTVDMLDKERKASSDGPAV